MVREIQSKFDGTCTKCKQHIKKNSTILWDSETKLANHKGCGEPKGKKKKEKRPAFGRGQGRVRFIS